MYRQEWLPKALKIGMSEELFWKSNPRKMKPYMTAYEETRKEQMEAQNILSYVQGIYFMNALDATVGNMFRSGQKAEYPKEPYPFFEPKQEMTEDEKSKQVELLFAELEAMQHNFELEKSQQ